MHRLLTLLFFVAISAFSLHSQTDVTLKLHHKLGDQDFELNMEATNKAGDKFIVSRLQYYVSEISLIHDGGIETPITDLYLLVDASEELSVDLGNHDINNIEQIKLHVGVDPDHNHLDPSSYPVGHPLAPHFPSMHWGWESGYRFVAMEGQGGDGLDQPFELHGLGDENYFETILDVHPEKEGNQITVELNADYTNALADISVKLGVIVHGSNLEAKTMLENFNSVVFTDALVSSVTNIDPGHEILIAPNPSIGGSTQILLSSQSDYKVEVQISDLLGRTIDRLSLFTNQKTPLFLNQSGSYFLTFIKEGKFLNSQRLIVR